MPPEALRNFEESHAIYVDLDVPLTIGYLLLDRADMLWRLGRYDEAERLVNEVPATANRLDNKYRQVLLARMALLNSEIALSKDLLPQARRFVEQSLTLASQSDHTTAEAKYNLSLIQLRSADKKEAPRTSEAAVVLAQKINDRHLLSETLLVQAQALLENSDAKEALVKAREAKDNFARHHQYESEWRAWLVMARASQRLGDLAGAREGVSQIHNLLTVIQQKWETESFNRYKERSDIKRLLRVADELQPSSDGR